MLHFCDIKQGDYFMAYCGLCCKILPRGFGDDEANAIRIEDNHMFYFEDFDPVSAVKGDE